MYVLGYDANKKLMAVNRAVKEMRDIDSREAFEKDDETGTVFKALLEIVEELEQDNEK